MCKVIQKVFDNNKDIIRARRASGKRNKWAGSIHEEVKGWDNTDKGDLGEFTTRDMLKSLDYKSEIIDGGIGEFDILLETPNTTLRLEHKLATEDTNNHFQFNGIKKDVNYDYVFAMGVSPNELCFTILSLEEAQKTLTTLMAKNVEGAYKYTVSKNKMIEYTLENFKREIEKIV